MRADFAGKGPIEFESVPLPIAAKRFENLPFWDELNSEIQDWLLDLNYSWGRTRQLKSKLILRHVAQVRARLTRQQMQAFECLRKSFPEWTEADLQEEIAEWGVALNIMEEKAQTASNCHWTIHPQEDDLERNITLAIGLLKGGKLKNSSGQIRGILSCPPVGLEFKVRSLPRDEQLRLLVTISDGLSDPRPNFFQKLWGKLRR